MSEPRWQLGNAPSDDTLFRHMGDGILLMAMQVTQGRWIARIFRHDDKIWAGDEGGYRTMRDATSAADLAWFRMRMQAKAETAEVA
jgi:hypothetical protein